MEKTEEKKEEEEEEEEGVNDNVLLVEEVFLVEERVTRVRKRSLVCCQYPRTRVGLLLCRGSLFVVGAALVIGAGVSSQYHPPVGRGNYSECSSNTSDYEEELISSTTASLHSETRVATVLPSSALSIIPSILPSTMKSSLLPISTVTPLPSPTISR